ncbi:ADL160Wp [Eremothecium gossypii ATCC 10895]|uniref:ADL160Wp n=1 Tax=Eremothecium gossypii (strain ATCC 10895 / CBS 109.51 / FGSC 9923 / NRRL Y-1056) TaxID=284811 RepID=Q75AT0_EREGS|nr:ADL160Wp [Eremothecium gossypii ATCC 10895]AAS51760.2 ADL160Wp [Eremothecium gossypii ATCC 10895]AEY96057.1 FADL160Wp [Eremothecium gossypii FDAG1]
MSFSDEEDFDDIYGDDNKQNSETAVAAGKRKADGEAGAGPTSKEEAARGADNSGASAAETTTTPASSLDQLAALQVLSSNLNQLQQSTNNNSNNNTNSSDSTSNDSNKGNVPDQMLARGMPDLSQLQQLQQTMNQLQQQAAPLTQQQQQEAKQVKADLSRDINKMFIGGLNWETTEDNLREYFSKYGNVTEVKIMRDGTTGRSRGFGFLSFADASSVDEVVKTQHILDGKVIDPKRAIPREEQDKTGKIFVGGIGPDVRPKEFEEFFSQWGSIIDAQLMLDKDTGRSRGFGFITYDSPDAVDRVCQNKFIEFKGKRIEIKRAEPRQVQKQRTTNASPTGQPFSLNTSQAPQPPQQQFQMMANPMMANPLFNPQAMADYYAKMQEYYQQSGIDYSQMYQQQMQQMQQMMSMMTGGNAPAGGMPAGANGAGGNGDDTNGVPTIGEDSSSTSSGKDNNDKESSNNRHDSYGNRDRERSPDARRGHRNYNDREEGGHGFRRENRDRGFRGRERRGGGYGRDRRGYHPYSR